MKVSGLLALVWAFGVVDASRCRPSRPSSSSSAPGSSSVSSSISSSASSSTPSSSASSSSSIPSSSASSSSSIPSSSSILASSSSSIPSSSSVSSSVSSSSPSSSSVPSPSASSSSSPSSSPSSSLSIPSSSSSPVPSSSSSISAPPSSSSHSVAPSSSSHSHVPSSSSSAPAAPSQPCGVNLLGAYTDIIDNQNVDHWSVVTQPQGNYQLGTCSPQGPVNDCITYTSTFDPSTGSVMPYQYGYIYSFVPVASATYRWSFSVTSSAPITSSPTFTCSANSPSGLVLSQTFDFSQVGTSWTMVGMFFTPPPATKISISCVGVLTQSDTVISMTGFSLVRNNCPT